MRVLPPTPPPGPILGLSIKADANYYYRTITPLRAVTGATWATYESVTPEQLHCAETVIVNRMAGPVAAMQAMFRSLRQQWGIRRILVDYDDTWLEPHAVKSVRATAAAVAGVRFVLAHCDGVIVPNRDAQAHYGEHTDAPVAMVPNLLWPNDWQAPAVRLGQPPIIVIAGSPSHRHDWDLVVPALIALRQQRPDVGLRVLGCPHPTLMALRTEGREWTHDLAEYADLLSGATIALCPLQDTLFNRCKGNAKPAEYNLASGAAVIGSRVQYGEILATERGIVIDEGDPWAWARAIDLYLRNEARRYGDACALRDYICTDLHAAYWRDQLTRIYTMEESAWHSSLKEQTA
jgi:glycosyltransferase involved in cell wall biosynthesis